MPLLLYYCIIGFNIAARLCISVILVSFVKKADTFSDFQAVSYDYGK